MAKRTIPKGDTFPALRLSVQDQEGLVDLTAALGRITGFFEGRDDRGAFIGTIVGDVVPIAPPEEGLDEDGRSVSFNARYAWQAGDTDRILSYRGQVRVEWDAAGEQVETFPSGANGEPVYFEFAIVDNLDPS